MTALAAITEAAVAYVVVTGPAGTWGACIGIGSSRGEAKPGECGASPGQAAPAVRHQQAGSCMSTV
jgi:hypothetical protein